MRTDEKDILAGSEELKKMPYTVPEDYFSALETSVLEKTVRQRRTRGGFRYWAAQLVPAAAVVTLIVTAGLLLSRGSQDKAEEQIDYAFYRSEDLIPVTQPEAFYLSYYSEPAEEISAEDIVNYLIATGVDLEDLVNE